MIVSTLLISSLMSGTANPYTYNNASRTPIISDVRTLSGDYVTQSEAVRRLAEKEAREAVNKISSQQRLIEPEIAEALKQGLGEFMTAGFPD